MHEIVQNFWPGGLPLTLAMGPLALPFVFMISTHHHKKKCKKCMGKGSKCDACKHCGKDCKYCRKNDCRPGGRPPPGLSADASSELDAFSEPGVGPVQPGEDEDHGLDAFVETLKATAAAHGYPDARVGISLTDVDVNYFNGNGGADMQSTAPIIDSMAGIIDYPDGTGHVRLTGMSGFGDGVMYMPVLEEKHCWRPNGTVVSVAADGTQAKLGDWMVEFGDGCARDAWDPCKNAVAIDGYIPHCNTASVDPATGAAFGAMAFYG